MQGKAGPARLPSGPDLTTLRLAPPPSCWVYPIPGSVGREGDLPWPGGPGGPGHKGALSGLPGRCFPWHTEGWNMLATLPAHVRDATSTTTTTSLLLLKHVCNCLPAWRIHLNTTPAATQGWRFPFLHAPSEQREMYRPAAREGKQSANLPFLTTDRPPTSHNNWCIIQFLCDDDSRAGDFALANERCQDHDGPET